MRSSVKYIRASIKKCLLLKFEFLLFYFSEILKSSVNNIENMETDYITEKKSSIKTQNVANTIKTQWGRLISCLPQLDSIGNDKSNVCVEVIFQIIYFRSY